MASADEGEQQPSRSLLPGEEQPGEMPESFCIGTKRAYARGYEYPYKKQKIDMETVYVCTKGSDNARENEVLVLRREEDGWIAYDSSITGNVLRCRQGAFRSRDENIAKQGYHQWEMNRSANKRQEVDDPDWFGNLWCLTNVTETESSG